MKLINCRGLADKIKDNIAQEIFDLCANTETGHPLFRRPSLAIILIGSLSDSTLYVKLKQKTATTVGVDTHLYKFTEDANQQEVLDTLNFLNNDDTIDGILVQLPLPAQLDTDKIIATISPTKDVDGFHPDNIKKLLTSNFQLPISNFPVSPVFQSILACLEEVNFDLNHQQVVIVAKPGIFTNSLDELLESLGAKVVAVEPNNLGVSPSEADLLITAVGQANLINEDNVKNGAVIIDVGISKNKLGQTCGDVNADNVATKASWLTPVPGGIGPMTVAFALKNTLDFFKKR